MKDKKTMKKLLKRLEAILVLLEETNETLNRRIATLKRTVKDLQTAEDQVELPLEGETE